MSGTVADPALTVGFQKWGMVAQWVSGVGSLAASVVALFLASWSGADAERRAVQDRAFNAYERYLLLAVERPVLASGNLERIRAAQLEDAYGWFFGVLGTATDEVLHAFPADAGWKRAISTQLSLHCSHIGAMRADERAQYSVALQGVLRDVAQSCGRS